MWVKDKVAVVTGGGSGIGRASACALSREGARVLVVDLQGDAAQATCELIRNSGGAAVPCQADISTAEGAEEMISRAVLEFGSLDVLHNNAGIAVRGTVTEQDEEGWDRCVRVNLKTVYFGSKSAIPRLLERGGSIINISSLVSTLGFPNASVYSGTKGAVDSITRSLAKELGPRGIRVNAINPGMVETEGTHSAGITESDMRKQVEAQTPLGRIGKPQDIAGLAVFLASADSSWITGETFVISGGNR